MTMSDQDPIEPEPGDTPDVVAIAVREEQQLAAPTEQEQKAIEVMWTPQQKEMIRLLCPKDATPTEVLIFLYHAARTGLDPIAKQIYFIKRNGKMTIQTGIDGYRVVGHRTGKIAGVDDAVFEEGPDGNPVKATVTVWKIADDGQRYPYTATARWKEYAPDLSKSESFMWKKMPHGQLGKCAETLAWRKACPAELSGVYTDDEMAQADFGSEPAVVDSGFPCPHCGAPVEDRRENPGTRPLWACTNRDCGGGSKDKRGGNYPWGSFDPDYFAPTREGDYDGTLAVSHGTGEAPPVVEADWVDNPPTPRQSAAAGGDVWAELLAALSEGAGLGTREDIEARCRRLCRLMEVNNLWPSEPVDSLHVLLKKWPQVDHWADLGKKATMIEFAQAVAAVAGVKVSEKLRDEAAVGGLT